MLWYVNKTILDSVSVVLVITAISLNRVLSLFLIKCFINTQLLCYILGLLQVFLVTGVFCHHPGCNIRHHMDSCSLKLPGQQQLFLDVADVNAVWIVHHCSGISVYPFIQQGNNCR